MNLVLFEFVDFARVLFIYNLKTYTIALVLKNLTHPIITVWVLSLHFVYPSEVAVLFPEKRRT